MTILNPVQWRTLTFIRAANHGGSTPSPEEVVEWVERPDIRRGKVTRRTVKAPSLGFDASSLGAAIAANKMLAAANIDTSKSFELFNKKMMDAMAPVTSLGKLSALWEEERVVEEREPDETIVEQLLRFRWVRTNATGAGLVLTDLGRALLRSDAEESDDSDVIILDGDDPLAWGSLVGKIADIGECLIVDPYLHAQQFLDIAKFTGTTRVILKRPQKDNELVTWQVHQAVSGSNVDIRIAEPHLLHDRYIVGDAAVYTLGCSLSGVGRKPTTLVAHHGVVADQIRKAVEDLWTSAESIGDPPDPPEEP